MVGLDVEDSMKPIRVICKVKERWEKQQEAVKDAQYIESLMLKDLVRSIKCYELMTI